VLRNTLIPEKAGVGVSIGGLYFAVGLAFDDALCSAGLYSKIDPGSVE
jgi:hypothetical protein